MTGSAADSLRTVPSRPASGATRRIRVVWNPTAGSKAGIPISGTSEDQLRDLMARHGLGADLVTPQGEDEAVAAVREAKRDGFEMVVAAGGDGTAALVAREVMRTPTAMGILPLGSAMNVARSLGIPRDLEGAASILAEGHVRVIDLADANGHTFVEAASVGINAAVFAEAERLDDGEVGGLVGMFREAARFRPARMRISLDDRTVTTRALMVVVANMPYTGLGLTVAPDASVDDGRLDIRVFEGFGKLELLAYVVSVMFGGQPRHRKVQTYRSREVTIQAQRPHPARADSVDLGTTPTAFAILPRALRVIAPAPAPAADDTGARPDHGLTSSRTR